MSRDRRSLALKVLNSSSIQSQQKAMGLVSQILDFPPLKVVCSLRSISLLLFRLFPIIFALAYYSLNMGDNVVLIISNTLSLSPITAWITPGLQYVSNFYSFSSCPATYQRSDVNMTQLASLVYFIVTWHFICETIHQAALQAQKSPRPSASNFILIGLLIIQLLAKVVLFFYTDSPSSERPWTMFALNVIYLALNVIGSAFPSFFQFSFFFSEGLLILQFLSDNIAKELNFELFMLYLPILLLVEAYLISVELRGWNQSLNLRTFARVIGKHDAIILFMVFLGVSYFFNLIDALQKAYMLGMPLCTFPYALWLISSALASQTKSLPFKTVLLMLFYIVMYLLSLFLVCDIGFHKTEEQPEVVPPSETTGPVEGSETIVVEDF